MVAVYNNRLAIASLLIDKGANVDNADINGLNILHFAVDSGCIDNVKFALKFVEINCKDNMGWTPLLRAG